MRYEAHHGKLFIRLVWGKWKGFRFEDRTDRFFGQVGWLYFDIRINN